MSGPWGAPPPFPEPWESDGEPEAPALERTAEAVFLGRRMTLFWMLLRGYVLTLLTVGMYRFWLLTRKRRFYWSNTLIDGQPLEYTGRSIQLLIGFLLAVLVFIPLYGFLFYFTTVYPDLAGVSYILLGVVLYFLAGYALYRGRRFRLTRTLWRGIRFGQSGNAWGYALRRFGWTIAMIVTLGLVYPLMAASLYRYRFSNTWFGDRRFTFNGRARTIAGPFYLIYALNIGVLISGSVLFGQFEWVDAEGMPFPADGAFASLLAPLAVLGVSVPCLISRMRSRMFSSISIGGARIGVRIRARWLLAQYGCYALLLTIISTVFFLGLGMVLLGAEDGVFDGLIEMAAMFGRGLGTIVLIALAYLCVVATYALAWEIVLGFGYWKLVVSEARIENVDSLSDVRAQGGESPNIGEGFADALNVGAY